MKIETVKDTPSTCRICQASIVWAITEVGKRMPVDITPDPKGRLILYTEVDFTGNPVDPNVHRVRFATAADVPGPRWLSHFATCSARKRTTNNV